MPPYTLGTRVRSREIFVLLCQVRGDEDALAGRGLRCRASHVCCVELVAWRRIVTRTRCAAQGRRRSDRTPRRCYSCEPSELVVGGSQTAPLRRAGSECAAGVQHKAHHAASRQQLGIKCDTFTTYEEHALSRFVTLTTYQVDIPS